MEFGKTCFEADGVKRDDLLIEGFRTFPRVEKAVSVSENHIMFRNFKWWEYLSRYYFKLVWNRICGYAL